MEYEEFEEFDTAAEWMAAQERLALRHYEEYADALEEYVPAPRRELA